MLIWYIHIECSCALMSLPGGASVMSSLLHKNAAIIFIHAFFAAFIVLHV